MAFVIINGKEYSGENVEIAGGRLTIGRSVDCDLILRDKEVSTRHAQVVIRDKVYWLQDLGSTNGTLIKNRKIIQQKLVDGSIFTIGKYEMSFTDRDSMDDDHKDATSEQIRQSIHSRLITELNLKKLTFEQMADRTLRKRAAEVLDRIISELPREVTRKYDMLEMKKAVLDAALGLGPLEDMLEDKSISEIMVNAPNRIYIEQNGRLKLSKKTFSTKQEILLTIERIVGPIGRRIDESSPMVDARLLDGSRVNAIIPPLALDSPTITIRKFPERRLKVEDLITYGSLSKSMASFIRVCIIAAKNMIISGGTGSGKTTLLNVMSSFIPDGERIITIEDSAELSLPQDHVVRLETRSSNIEGKGEISIRDLVRNALRMRPNRIVVGECRGGEALDMLQAMNTGHDGSLTTTHANSPDDAIHRLENLVLMAGMELPLKAIRELIYSSVNVIIQISRFPDGSRKIVSIAEVASLYKGDIQLQEIFGFKRTGVNSEGRIEGFYSASGVIPKFVEGMREAGLDIDMSMFIPLPENT